MIYAAASSVDAGQVLPYTLLGIVEHFLGYIAR